MNYRQVLALPLIVTMIGFGACAKTAQEEGGKRATPVTVTTAALGSVRVSESSTGTLESLAAPFVDAEVAGQVTTILADVGQDVRPGQPLARLDTTRYRSAVDAARAETARLSALVANQERNVARYRELSEEKFVQQSMLEDIEAQFIALKEQHAAAKARLEQAERDLSKTEITAPVGGKIEARLVDAGGYVEVGAPLFRIASNSALRARLPLPETVASVLARGQKVILATPTAPEASVTGIINEIRPMVSGGARAVEVIVDIPNPGGWRAGASVTAVVMIEERQAVTLPAQSVVLRPAGTVVYAMEGGAAVQKSVVTGVRRGGMIEIVEGVKPGDTIVVDGAGYLTDKAPVQPREEK